MFKHQSGVEVLFGWNCLTLSRLMNSTVFKKSVMISDLTERSMGLC